MRPQGKISMTKSRFSSEAAVVCARYTIDDGALSRQYDEAFKRAFRQSRESDASALRDLAKTTEHLLARARGSFDSIAQELGARFAASDENMKQSLTRTRAQRDTIAALVRDEERRSPAYDADLAILTAHRAHEALARKATRQLEDSAQITLSAHRLLLETCAYGFSAVSRGGDTPEGYAFVVKALARMLGDFAQGALLMSLVEIIREWSAVIDRRLQGATTGSDCEVREMELHTTALELYCELTELTLEHLACE
jgi:exonuclease VII large subunit